MKRSFILSLFTLFCAPTALATYSPDWPADEEWYALTQDGLILEDVFSDGAGKPRNDLVGDEEAPLGYWTYDGDWWFFRMRLDDTPVDGSNLYGDAWGLLIDTNSKNAQYEYAVVLNGGGYYLRFIENTSGDGVTDEPETVLASWSDAYEADDSGCVRVAGTTESEFGSDDDVFLDFAVSRGELASVGAIQTDTGFQVALGTTWDNDSAITFVTDRSGADDDLGVPDLNDTLSDLIGIDIDGDGLGHIEEIEAGSDPHDPDTDGDGLSDYDEVMEHGTDPTDEDSDDDGLYDKNELDGGTDPLDEDTDDDGLLDGEEGLKGTDPLDEDSDDDGLLDGEEADYGTDPMDADTDDDGLDDGAEVSQGTDPTSTDTDGDGCDDAEELSNGSDPLDPEDDCDDSNVVDTGGDEDEGCVDDAVFCAGSFTGGACSALPFGAALGPALFFAFVAVFRRRRSALMVAAAFPAVASAQDFDAQTFDPAVDGREFVRIDDSVVGTYGAGGGVLFNYADDPLVFRYDDGTRGEQRVLGSIATADLLGYYNLKPFRVGLALPVQAYAASGSDDYALEGPTLLGDLRLDVKAELLERADGPLGVGVAVRGLIPTGNEEAWVGHGTFGVQALALLSYGESWVGTVNAGFGTGNGSQLDDLTLGNQMLWGAGLSVPVDERARLSAELTGSLYLGADTAAGAGPIEALTAFKFNPAQDLVVSLGAGGGLTPGIGAPDFRVVTGLSWTPGFTGGAASGVKLESTASATSDRDGDGILDAVDLCPDQPEDHNGKADTDGCPDGNWTPTTIRVLDSRGGQVSGANVAFVQGPMTGEWHTTDGVLTRSLSPGNYQVQVMAEGFALNVTSLDVPTAEQHEATVRLIPGQAPDARVVLHVSDVDGKPVAATVRVLGVKSRRVRGESDGVVEFPIEAGAYELVVHAPGYGTARRTVKVDANGSASIDVVLKRARVEITDKRIVILDKIFFELDSDVIKADSFAILDEVVESLLTHGAISLLEVQGHTDDQGKEDYNLGLSQRRAEAVIKYLVASGVQPQRVVARGYGEAKPLQPGETDEARAANRRVEFHILRRAKPLKAAPAVAPATPAKNKKKRKGKR